uniref:PiggyBac transposable element-derived protein domain-containing protein n=1 Tax=Strigamia maritima TaxID=126957 RepID=T1IRM5_STRMM
MARDRFIYLLKFLRFDDVKARHERMELEKKIQLGLVDPPDPPIVPLSKLAPIENVLTNFINVLPTLYEPGDNITVDEMLVKFRGGVSFRVYMKSKPARYGIKVLGWGLFVFTLCVYTGKVDDQRELKQGKRVDLDMTGRGITADNFFSSKELVLELSQNGLTYETKSKRVPFIQQLALNLITEHMQRRVTKSVPSKTSACTSLVASELGLQLPVELPQKLPNSDCGRCKICKMSSRLKCSKCHFFVCKSHQLLLCSDCNQE